MKCTLSIEDIKGFGMDCGEIELSIQLAALTDARLITGKISLYFSIALQHERFQSYVRIEPGQSKDKRCDVA